MKTPRVGRIVAAGLFLIWAGAAAAAPPASPGLDVACAKMGGAVHFDVKPETDSIVLDVSYPKNIGSYLGGFSHGTKDAGADVKFYLDTDSNPETGMKGDPIFAAGAKGSEYSIETQEVETSVAKDAAGNWINRPVLMVMVQKQDEFFDLPDGVSLRWEMEIGGKYAPIDWMNVPASRTMRMTVPISAFGLKSGAKIRITAVVPLCKDSFPFPGIAESTLALK
jgi:hypothetical protein